jgi:hypothetical protein
MVMRLKSVFLDKYCLMSLLLYSLRPLCQEAYGCAKKTSISNMERQVFREVEAQRYLKEKSLLGMNFEDIFK